MPSEMQINDATWLASMGDSELREYVLGMREFTQGETGVSEEDTTQRLREHAIFVTLFVLKY